MRPRARRGRQQLSHGRDLIPPCRPAACIARSWGPTSAAAESGSARPWERTRSTTGWCRLL